MDATIRLGFGRADMTPGPGVQMGGYGNEDKRTVQRILDPLYATCLAFTDSAGETALVYTVDMLFGPGWARPAVAQALGLPVDRVQFSGTHTHAAPAADGRRNLPGSNVDLPEVMAYRREVLVPALIAAGKQALADRKEAEMSFVRTHVKGMDFVRRYLMEDGSWSGPNFGDWKKTPVAHESPVDDELQLVKFARKGGKDVLLCNFQTHQTMTGGMQKYDVSADGCGAMRAAVEGQTDFLFAYFTGASGNVVPNSRLPGETRFENEQYKEYGQTLAGEALAVLPGLRPLPGGRVAVKSVHVEGRIDHHLDHLADKLLPIARLWEETGDRPRCNALARELGLNSIYNVQSALGKMALGKTEGIDLDVVQVGELAFVMAPYEMFDTNGMAVKAASPFGMTVMATCANYAWSYIPSKLAFEHGGYEVDRCQFVPGFAEQLADTYAGMLNELHTK